MRVLDIDEPIPVEIWSGPLGALEREWDGVEDCDAIRDELAANGVAFIGGGAMVAYRLEVADA